MPLNAEQRAILAESDRVNALMHRGIAHPVAAAAAPMQRPQQQSPTRAASNRGTQSFLGELCARAGIANTSDPNAILQALDSRIASLIAAAPKSQQQLDSEMDREMAALFGTSA